MREVVMDTNFLLLPFQFKIDIFKELEYIIDGPFQLVTSSKVLSELRGISRKTGKAGAAARFALKLIAAKEDQLKTISTRMPVDDWILEYSREHRAIACTNDAILKKRLKKQRLKVVGLRTKTKLGYV